MHRIFNIDFYTTYIILFELLYYIQDNMQNFRLLYFLNT